MRSGNPRVGFVSLHDPANPAALSGMPHSIFEALRRQDLDLVDLGRLDRAGPPTPAGVRSMLEAIARTCDRIRGRLGHGEEARWRRDPTTMARRFEARCRRLAANLARAIDLHRPDILFGNCISSPIAFLDREIPIVYTGDATAEIVSTTYPRYVARGPEYAAVTDEIERRALRRVRFAVFASPATRRSAVETYGMPPERTAVVGYGANVDPRVGVEATTTPPTRDSLILTITAADPVRKRVNLAIECVGVLRSRGWNASIDVVGPVPKAPVRHDWIRRRGPLDHAVPDEVVAHARIIATSHLCLLPSSGEAYGIAPIESAAFGRPAVVTDVGGLPFVVLDGETGRVVRLDADAAELADAVESIVADPAVYTRMSHAARARAEAELNWDAWAEAVAIPIRKAHLEQTTATR